MKTTTRLTTLLSLLLLLPASALAVNPPGILNYQGLIAVGATPYSGTGYFKFALVNNGVTETFETFWSNNGTGTGTPGSQPTAAVTATVSQGRYTVRLGDTNFHANMNNAVGAGVFTGHADVRLRVWFSTAPGGPFELLAPDQRLLAAGYALSADTAMTLAGTVAASQLTGTINDARLSGNVSLFGTSIDSSEIANGAIGSNQLATGAVTTPALADGAVSVSKLQTLLSMPLLTTFTSPSPAGGDFFGQAVAVVGTDKVLIGAYADDTGANNAGAAYLFSANGTLLTIFTNPTPADFDNFGAAVAAVGTDKVLIRATGDDTGATDTGAAYLFSTNGTLLTTFTNPTPAFGDGFGTAVTAVGADKVLIGASNDDAGATDAGAVYLFRTNGTLLTTFTNPTPAFSDNFGFAVAAVGTDKVLIGAYNDDTGAINTGAAYLFRTNGTLLTTFTNPTPAVADLFGAAVAAVGADKVLIGAYGDDTGAPDAGAAYLFSTNGTLLTTFTNPAPANLDIFGTAVAAVGTDKVLIGASLDDTGADNAGAAYLFSTNGTLLAIFNNPTPASDDWFGNMVTAFGTDKVLVGNYASDGGAAYLFSLTGTPYVPGLVSQGVVDNAITTAGLAPVAVTTDKIADGSVTTDKIADGSVTANDLNADVLNGTFWKLGGNTGTTPGTHFLGTTDNQPLEFKVNNQRGLRLEHADNGFFEGVNVIGGYSGNAVGSGVVGATIAGGGRSGPINQVTADSGTVGGGYGNTASGNGSTVGGGQGNDASGGRSTVGGGQANDASLEWSTVGGGEDNMASGNWSTVGGGQGNEASGGWSAVPGGRDNRASAAYSFAAGRRAKAANEGAFVWADGQNADFASTANNQFLIRASGGVGIGTTSPADLLHVVGQSTRARVESTDTTFAGYITKNSQAEWFTGIYESGGAGTWAIYQNSPAGGTRLVVTTSGNVGIGTTDPGSTLEVVANNSVGTTDGTGLISAGPQNAGHIAIDTDDIQRYIGNTPSTLFLNDYGGNVDIGSSGFTTSVQGTFQNTSDRNLKEDIQPVASAAVLNRLLQMPVSTWKFKDAASRRHVGPMAQDFHAAFNDLLDLNADDKTIAPLDEAGVAFVSIQALNGKVEEELKTARAEKDKQLGELKSENAALRERQDRLASDNTKMHNRLSRLDDENAALRERLDRLEKIATSLASSK